MHQTLYERMEKKMPQTSQGGKAIQFAARLGN